MPWPLRGVRNGVLATGWPRRPDEYADEYPAAVTVRGPASAGHTASGYVAEVARGCPTGAIVITGDRVELDQGRCVLCGRCVDAAPDVFGWQRGPAAAALDRSGLVVPHRDGTDDEIARVRADLARRVRRMRRSVHIRHVDTGSDGSDEWEVAALLNPVYDVNRLGIFVTASPRHADVLLATGIGATGMTAALARTREAMPDPVIVIVAGADAISGGLFRGGYAGTGGAAGRLDVDVWVPGSPATPFDLLQGILLALGRVPERSDGGGGRR